VLDPLKVPDELCVHECVTGADWLTDVVKCVVRVAAAAAGHDACSKSATNGSEARGHLANRVR